MQLDWRNQKSPHLSRLLDQDAYELLERIHEQVEKNKVRELTDAIREVKSDLEFVIEQTGKCQDRLFRLEIGMSSKFTSTWIWLGAQTIAFTALAIVLRVWG
jgi:hypothetical protein